MKCVDRRNFGLKSCESIGRACSLRAVNKPIKGDTPCNQVFLYVLIVFLCGTASARQIGIENSDCIYFERKKNAYGRKNTTAATFKPDKQ